MCPFPIAARHLRGHVRGTAITTGDIAVTAALPVPEPGGSQNADSPRTKAPLLAHGCPGLPPFKAAARLRRRVLPGDFAPSMDIRHRAPRDATAQEMS